jgi:hypothetical protein
LWEHPTVTCKIRLLASLGGLMIIPSYFTSHHKIPPPVLVSFCC